MHSCPSPRLPYLFKIVFLFLNETFLSSYLTFLSSFKCVSPFSPLVLTSLKPSSSSFSEWNGALSLWTKAPSLIHCVCTVFNYDAGLGLEQCISNTVLSPLPYAFISFFIKSHERSPLLKAWLFPEAWCLRRHRRSLGLTPIKPYYHIFWGINSGCQAWNVAEAVLVHLPLRSLPLLLFCTVGYIDISVLLRCLVFISHLLLKPVRRGRKKVFFFWGVCKWGLTIDTRTNIRAH